MQRLQEGPYTKKEQKREIKEGGGQRKGGNRGGKERESWRVAKGKRRR